MLPNLEKFTVYDNNQSLLDLANLTSEEDIDDFIEDEHPYLPVKYGDNILIKTLSRNKRYLTGGRGGNVLTETGQLNENVFCTDEDRSKLEWIIKSKIGENDPKKNEPVRFGDGIYLQVSNIHDRYLQGGISMKYLPYSPNVDQAVLTISQKYNKDNRSMWFIKTNQKNENRSSNDVNNGKILNYMDDFVLQSNANENLFLSGARGSYMLDDENDSNQQVFTVNSDDGYFELRWIFTKNKIDIDLSKPDCIKSKLKWPLWKFEPGIIGKSNWKNLITASSSEGYGPYVNNMKQPYGYKSSDKIFGEPCIGGREDNACWKISKSDSGWVAGSPDCKNEFLVLNFGKELFIEKVKIYPRKDLHHTNEYVKEFSVKTAKSNGIFLDLNYKYMTNFDIDWFKSGERVIIKNYNDKPLKMLLIGAIIESSKNILGENTNLLDETFIVFRNNDNTISFKSEINNKLIKANDDLLTISHSSEIIGEIDSSYNTSKFKIIEHEGKYAFKTVYNTYLSFQNTKLSQIPSPYEDKITSSNNRELFIVTKLNNDKSLEFEFKVNRILQFLKIIPLKSNIACAMRISAYGKNSNIDLVELLKKNSTIPIKASSCRNFKNGERSRLTDGNLCSYGGYETDKLNMFSNSGWSTGQKDKEDPFLFIDLGNEQCVKGGILYARDNYDDIDCLSCDQYVKKFQIQIAGNNKLFREIGTFKTDFTGNSPGKNSGYKFPIYKNNIRYIKLIMTQCNQHCSLRLDIF